MKTTFTACEAGHNDRDALVRVTINGMAVGSLAMPKEHVPAVLAAINGHSGLAAACRLALTTFRNLDRNAGPLEGIYSEDIKALAFALKQAGEHE